MKLKQQASGWPSECTNEDKKRKYLDDYNSLAVVVTGILTSAFKDDHHLWIFGFMYHSRNNEIIFFESYVTSTNRGYL